MVVEHMKKMCHLADELMNKMCHQLVCIPGLSIEIKSQVFNYFVIHVIIPQYHFFYMAGLGKAVVCTPLLILSHLPPKLALYFRLQFSTVEFLCLKYKLHC